MVGLVRIVDGIIWLCNIYLWCLNTTALFAFSVAVARALTVVVAVVVGQVTTVFLFGFIWGFLFCFLDGRHLQLKERR